MLEVSKLTGLHKNTIRNYIKEGKLKAELSDSGKGKQTWVIEEADLYNCGIPYLLTRLGPQDTQQKLHKSSTAEFTDPDKYLAEITRLHNELTAANTELGILRFQVPVLQAAQEERDRLAAKVEVTEAALAQAQANSKWSWRRRMAKAGG